LLTIVFSYILPQLSPRPYYTLKNIKKQGENEGITAHSSLKKGLPSPTRQPLPHTANRHILPYLIAPGAPGQSRGAPKKSVVGKPGIAGEIR